MLLKLYGELVDAYLERLNVFANAYTGRIEGRSITVRDVPQVDPSWHACLARTLRTFLHFFRVF